MDIAKGDAYKSIKEVWVAAVYGTISRMTSREIVEEEVRKVEEGNQQLENECMECSKV